MVNSFEESTTSLRHQWNDVSIFSTGRMRRCRREEEALPFVWLCEVAPSPDDDNNNIMNDNKRCSRKRRSVRCIRFLKITREGLLCPSKLEIARDDDELLSPHNGNLSAKDLRPFSW
jgi:hypothetical protein